MRDTPPGWYPEHFPKSLDIKKRIGFEVDGGESFLCTENLWIHSVGVRWSLGGRPVLKNLEADLVVTLHSC